MKPLQKPPLLLGAAMILASLFSFAVAQTIAPLPVPDVRLGAAGEVVAIAPQPDGGLILGGRFTMIDDVPRSNLARLHRDGTLDRDWNPMSDGEVTSLAVSATGDVYVAGRFENVDGQPRRNLAKLSGSGRGAVDPLWNPGADPALSGSTVFEIVLNERGDVFVSGDFSSYDTPRRYLAKLSGGGNGAMDPRWNPPMAARVQALVADGRGSIYAASEWPHGVCCLHKFSDSGTGAAAADWHPTLDTPPSKLAIAVDGSLHAGFEYGFAAADVGTRYLAHFRVDSRGEIDPAWLPLAPGPVRSLTTDAEGSVYVGISPDLGYGSTINKWVRDAAGGSVIYWRRPSRLPNALALAADGTLYVGGTDATSESASSQLGLERVDAGDGKTLPSVDVLTQGTVSAIAFQANGGTIVGGSFSKAGSTLRTNILRLEPDGRLDPDWNPSLEVSAIGALAVDENDDVYVGGGVSTLQPVPIVKLSGTGTGAADPTWKPFLDASGWVNSLAIGEGDALYVGGRFLSVEGVARKNVVKLRLSDAAVDESWNADTEFFVQAVAARGNSVYVASGQRQGSPSSGLHPVGTLARYSGTSGAAWMQTLPGAAYALALARDGAVYVGGEFPGDTQSGQYVLKFSQEGVPDANWNAAAALPQNPGAADTLALDAEDGVLVGGRRFVTDAPPFLRRLSAASGAIDAAWNPLVDGAIGTMARAADGDLWIGGNFANVSGQLRSGLAALPTVISPHLPHTHGQRPLPPILRNRPPRPRATVAPRLRAVEP